MKNIIKYLKENFKDIIMIIWGILLIISFINDDIIMICSLFFIMFAYVFYYNHMYKTYISISTANQSDSNETIDVYVVKDKNISDQYVYFLKDDIVDYLTNIVDDMSEDDEEYIIEIKVKKMTNDEYYNLPELY